MMQRNPKAVRMETVTQWAGYLRNNTRQQLDALHFVPDDIGKSIECEIPAEQSNALRMVCATFRWVDFLTARPMTARPTPMVSSLHKTLCLILVHHHSASSIACTTSSPFSTSAPIVSYSNRPFHLIWLLDAHLGLPFFSRLFVRQLLRPSCAVFW